MLLAAGRGARLRPATDTRPKPLLPVAGRPLIEWHLRALARAGVRQVVINTAWLEAMIPAALGDGARWGLAIHYVMEGRDQGGALDTAGGIANALPWLADAPDTPFWVVAADICAPGFDHAQAAARRLRDAPTLQAHLWMVPNPPFHPAGDFGIEAGSGLLVAPGAASTTCTFSGIGLFRAALFADIAPGTVAPLAPLLRRAVAERRIAGELYRGRWANVGTPQDLAAVAAPEWATALRAADVNDRPIVSVIDST